MEDDIGGTGGDEEDGGGGCGLAAWPVGGEVIRRHYEELAGEQL